MIPQPGVSRGGNSPGCCWQRQSKASGSRQAHLHLFSTFASSSSPAHPASPPVLTEAPPKDRQRLLLQLEKKTGRKRHLRLGCDLGRVCVILTLSLITPWQIAAVPLQAAPLLWGSPAEGPGGPPAQPSTLQPPWAPQKPGGWNQHGRRRWGRIPPHPFCWVREKKKIPSAAWRTALALPAVGTTAKPPTQRSAVGPLTSPQQRRRQPRVPPQPRRQRGTMGSGREGTGTRLRWPGAPSC